MGVAPDHGTPEFGEMMQAYGAFTEEVRGKDIMGGGDALQERVASGASRAIASETFAS